MRSHFPDSKLTIIGGGIVGYFEAYFAYIEALEKNSQVRVTIHEKNSSLQETTVMHLVPNLTPAEITGVIPSGEEFLRKMETPFDQPGGLLVRDVAGVNDSAVAIAFRKALLDSAVRPRNDSLLLLGQKSMDFWQAMFEHGDDELRRILIASNFHPCKERSREDKRVLHDGYRIDLTFNYPDAEKRARDVLAEYVEMGYQDCRILSPEEVFEIDPQLFHFCEAHSFDDEAGIRQWQHDAIAIWRPGGCIDTKIFLPLFHDYLTLRMGQYVDANGYVKNCFRVHYDRKVEGVVYENKHITGLKFFGFHAVKHNKQYYPVSEYAFCPGENVGTLRALGMDEPDYARIAGTSLIIRIPLTGVQRNEYANFNHYMSIFSEGVSCAWQARRVDNEIIIGMGGTKAFYGDQEPKLYDDFALSRALKLLNMMNEVLPSMLSLVLGRHTKGETLTMEDLTTLEKLGKATRWVGSRAIAYDGYPTLGSVYHEGKEVKNAHCTTHLGSGGNSFAPAAAYVSRNRHAPEMGELSEEVLKYADSRRRP